MLVGLLPPTSGDALIFGKNIVSDIVSLTFTLLLQPHLLIGMSISNSWRFCDQDSGDTF